MQNRILRVAGVAFTACLTLSESATAQRSEPSTITRADMHWNDLTCAITGDFTTKYNQNPLFPDSWEELYFSIEFHNKGTQAATFSTEVLMGVDTRTPTTKLSWIGNLTLGAGKSGKWGPFYHRNIVHGTHRYVFLAKADAANTSSESDERNNNCSVEVTHTGK